jgi:hypothetical protein
LADAERFARLEASGRRLLSIWDHDVWSNPDTVRLQILAFWRGGSTPGDQNPSESCLGQNGKNGGTSSGS